MCGGRFSFRYRCQGKILRSWFQCCQCSRRLFCYSTDEQWMVGDRLQSRIDNRWGSGRGDKSRLVSQASAESWVRSYCRLLIDSSGALRHSSMALSSYTSGNSRGGCPELERVSARGWVIGRHMHQE